MNAPNRRTVLSTAATSVTAALAGCAGLFDGEADDDANETDPSSAETEGRDAPDEAARQFVEALAAGQFERAHGLVASAYRDEIPTGLIEITWLGLTAVGGEFDRIVSTEEAVEGGFDVVDVTLEFEGVEDVLRIVVDDETAVAGYRLNGSYERPAYVDTGAFETQDLTLDADGCRLGSTVVVPDDADAVPGVVHVHGSGSSDRNLQNVATQTFKDFAEGLATRGVASIRYDKRTYACRVEPENHTIDRVTVDDALVAIEELRDVEGVDPDRIVVVGHSMGGTAVPRIVDRDGSLAGGVAMAAPARSFHDVALDQQEHLATLGDHEWEAQTEAYEQWADRIERVRAGDYEPGDLILGYPGALWDSLDAYDHVEVARAVDEPLLFCQGDRDYQVSPADDFERWRRELVDRDETAFERFDALNHLFMPGDGVSVMTEYAVRNNVAERAIRDVTDWIDAL